MEQIDEAEIAELVSQAINGTLAESAKEALGWDAIGLDIGEVEITLKDGRMFRLVVEEIESV